MDTYVYAQKYDVQGWEARRHLISTIFYDSDITLCGRDITGWWVGDETVTGIGATCRSCRRVMDARKA